MGTTSKKPLWFLDVDGTVNCFPAPAMEQLFASQEWRDSTLGRYRLWWREDVRDFINHMVREDLVEVIWLTTWKAEARRLVGPAMGLDDFEAVTHDEGSEDPSQQDWWKLDRVLTLAEDRPFVWTDDELHGSCAPERVKNTLKQESLLIAPPSNPGLGPGDMAAIEEFLRALEISHG